MRGNSIGEDKMSDQAVIQLPAATAAEICEKTGAKGCIVLVSDENGVTSLAAHGLSHFEANQMLSLGIHMNLCQHDELVLAGAAGEEAQARANQLKEMTNV
jgi:hypothetical protein